MAAQKIKAQSFKSLPPSPGTPIRWTPVPWTSVSWTLMGLALASCSGGGGGSGGTNSGGGLNSPIPTGALSLERGANGNFVPQTIPDPSAILSLSPSVTEMLSVHLPTGFTVSGATLSRQGDSLEIAIASIDGDGATYTAEIAGASSGDFVFFESNSRFFLRTADAVDHDKGDTRYIIDLNFTTTDIRLSDRTEQIAINIMDTRDEPPLITNGDRHTIYRNESDTEIYRVQGYADLVGDTITWSLTDNDGGTFTIGEDGRVILAEGRSLNESGHTIRIMATVDSQSSTQTLTINIPASLTITAPEMADRLTFDGHSILTILGTKLPSDFTVASVAVDTIRSATITFSHISGHTATLSVSLNGTDRTAFALVADNDDIKISTVSSASVSADTEYELSLGFASLDTRLSAIDGFRQDIDITITDIPVLARTVVETDAVIEFPSLAVGTIYQNLELLPAEFTFRDIIFDSNSAIGRLRLIDSTGGADVIYTVSRLTTGASAADHSAFELYDLGGTDIGVRSVHSVDYQNPRDSDADNLYRLALRFATTDERIAPTYRTFNQDIEITVTPADLNAPAYSNPASYHTAQLHIDIDDTGAPQMVDHDGDITFSAIAQGTDGNGVRVNFLSTGQTGGFLGITTVGNTVVRLVVDQDVTLGQIEATINRHPMARDIVKATANPAKIDDAITGTFNENLEGGFGNPNQNEYAAYAYEDIDDVTTIFHFAAIDADGDAVTYEITSDPSNLFEINAGGEVSLVSGASLNRATDTIHEITVEAISTSSGSAPKRTPATLQIIVDPPQADNHAPAYTTLAGRPATVGFSVGPSAQVASLADADIIFTAKALGVAGNNLRIEIVQPVGNVDTGVVINASSSQITIAIQDNGGATLAEIETAIENDNTARTLVDVDIASGQRQAAIEDISSAPGRIIRAQLEGGGVIIEASAITDDNDILYDFEAMDADRDIVTYSIQGNSNSLFEINADGELSLRSGASLDRSNNTSHDITIRAISNSNLPGQLQKHTDTVIRINVVESIEATVQIDSSGIRVPIEPFATYTLNAMFNALLTVSGASLPTGYSMQAPSIFGTGEEQYASFTFEHATERDIGYRVELQGDDRLDFGFVQRTISGNIELIIETAAPLRDISPADADMNSVYEFNARFTRIYEPGHEDLHLELATFDYGFEVTVGTAIDIS